jgi:hypothetical protein
MKENLKIRFNDFERQEVINLLRSIGKTLHDGAEKRWHEISIIYIYAKYDKLEWDTDSGDTFSIDDAKEITLPELRELARPKEYLNDKFELVVTNQPEDGFILVPDGAECATSYPPGANHKVLFWRKAGNVYQCFNAMRSWIDSRGGIDLFLKELNQTILWQRESKVETVKGRFLHQWAYEAFGRGEDLLLKMINNKSTVLQVNSAMGLHIFDDANNHFSLKPQTIQIGSRTINKPISVTPENGQTYFIVNLMNKLKYRTNVWRGTDLDLYQFNNNLCHLTAADSINHCDALLELTK